MIQKCVCDVCDITLDCVCMLQELDASLKKVLSGDLQSLILGLMMIPEQFEAHRLRKAMEVWH